MLAFGIVHLDLVGRKVKVAQVVHGQTVRTRIGKEGLVREGSFLPFVDVITEGFARPVVGHIEVFPVQSAEDPVGPLHVFDHSEYLIPVGRDVIDVLPVLG